MQERLVIGLNSGTSADGTDAVLVRLAGSGRELAIWHEGHLSRAHAPELRATLRRAPDLTLVEAAALGRKIADSFAEATLELLRLTGRDEAEVAMIGSHGQTVLHLPDENLTVQVGDLDLLAERTGIPVVGDFRARDVAAGGEGAPLSPYLDWVQFHGVPGTCVVNLGGIANATLVDGDWGRCRAGDLGPANLPLDTLAIMGTDGAEECDRDGVRAARGTVDHDAVEALLAEDPFLKRPFPRSTGREHYGRPFVEAYLERHRPRDLDDGLATLTEFVARSVAEGISTLAAGQHIERLLLAGGGSRNPTLRSRVGELMAPTPLAPYEVPGRPEEAREALLFAVLAHEWALGVPTSLPAATGASGPRILGRLAPGAGGRVPPERSL